MNRAVLFRVWQIEQSHSVFFVWLKSTICFILCLVGEPYEYRGYEREESAHIQSFLWSESIPTIYGKFSYEDFKSHRAPLFLN
jgi:hypothetical protein